MVDEPAKPKSRVSYAAEMKKAAADAGQGLVTISVTGLDGSKYEHQMVADVDETLFAKWAAALLGRRDVRPLPKLMEFVREVVERKETPS